MKVTHVHPNMPVFVRGCYVRMQTFIVRLTPEELFVTRVLGDRIPQNELTEALDIIEAAGTSSYADAHFEDGLLSYLIAADGEIAPCLGPTQLAKYAKTFKTWPWKPFSAEIRSLDELRNLL